ncbi:AAA domain-containing ATPase [Chloropicon primus]|uniref:AAA domain-containing ATPase n=2 Tax=Chloropicon primus TaxID=1764295 RepID=A0A5B8MMK7_9CHLO|nr:AAA domain-containing ATPase [Chloropicon primus]UPR00955.1 AAA domain-containing ATPase [Chloropicon primus]|eukprot:QDZ21733.1 AAA domain-containing ATPase [Chloropicon primus]
MKTMTSWFVERLAQGMRVVECDSKASSSSNANSGVGFDPEALERGAKALREINQSPHAKKVLDLAKTQELTKQQESKAKEAEMKAAASQYSVQQEKVRWEEQRKYAQEQAQHKGEIAKFEDQLARRRQEESHEKERQRNAEMVALQEQSKKRIEAEKLAIEQRIQEERRATEAYRIKMEKEQIRMKALAEAEGRTQEHRANEDIFRRELLLKMKEERNKAVQVAKAVLTSLGEGARDILTDQTKMAMLAGGISLMALGVYGSREGTKVAARAIDRYLGTPSLVRDTSRSSMFGRMRRMFSSGKEEEYQMKDIILNKGLGERIQSLSGSLLMTKQRGAPFRHMLFYGPPGTGKTMTAKVIAKQSNMDYAILTGGDIAPLGGDAVTQLHSLFDWSATSNKGLVLFIDEADAFLGDRGGKMVQSEGLRAALNALLYRTGDQSKHFSMILATNRPGDLDSAVLNRIDDALEFPNPEAEERRQLIELYLKRYVAENKSVKGPSIRVDITPGDLSKMYDSIAKDTKGFSGRDIAKMMSAVQAAVYGSVDGILTPAMFKGVVDYKLKEFQKRKELPQ